MKKRLFLLATIPLFLVCCNKFNQEKGLTGTVWERDDFDNREVLYFLNDSILAIEYGKFGLAYRIYTYDSILLFKNSVYMVIEGKIKGNKIKDSWIDYKFKKRDNTKTEDLLDKKHKEDERIRLQQEDIARIKAEKESNPDTLKNEIPVTYISPKKELLNFIESFSYVKKATITEDGRMCVAIIFGAKDPNMLANNYIKQAKSSGVKLKYCKIIDASGAKLNGDYIEGKKLALVSAK